MAERFAASREKARRAFVRAGPQGGSDWRGVERQREAERCSAWFAGSRDEFECDRRQKHRCQFGIGCDCPAIASDAVEPGRPEFSYSACRLRSASRAAGPAGDGHRIGWRTVDSRQMRGIGPDGPSAAARPENAAPGDCGAHSPERRRTRRSRRIWPGSG